MNDGSGHDAVLCHEPLGQLHVVETFDLEQRDRSGLSLIQRSQNLDAGALRKQALRPAVSQVTQASDLPIRSDSSMKGESGGDGVVIRGGMSADLLVFANFLVLLLRRGHQRPQLLLLLLLHVEKAGADRRKQPLMEACPVVIAAEIASLEGKVRESMSAVHENLDPPRSRELDDSPQGHYLSAEIRHVSDLDDFRPRSPRRAECLPAVVAARRRHLQRDLRSGY